MCTTSAAKDPERVCELWNELKTKGEFLLDGPEWERVKASGVCSARSTHEERIERIRKELVRTSVFG